MARKAPPVHGGSFRQYASWRGGCQGGCVRTEGTLFSCAYSYPLRHLPTRVADSARAARLAMVWGNPGAAKAVRETRLPSTYPPLQRILVGRDGTTWLELTTTAADREWRVLDRRGDPVATLRVPRRIEIEVADLTTVWATDTDEDGLERVVRFRVRR